MVRARVPAFGIAIAFSTFVGAQIPATITPRPRPSASQRSASQSSESQNTLRTDSSLVVIPTWVTTAAGASVTSLNKENFRVVEDNVEQPIAYFIQDDAPLSIGLLFDTSGSMRTKMDKASQSVAEFFKTANTEDEFFLVEFNDRAKLTIPFTLDSGEIYSRIARTKPFGRTSLLDSIQVALNHMKKARHTRKAIVIISDGGDNWSWHTARQIRGALLESDVQLYAMGIFDPDLSNRSPAENRNGPALLEELAGQTGGRHYPVGDLNDLPAISAKIGTDLRNEYLLGYYAAGSRDGKYHHVKVNLALPDGAPPLRANYRRGYYAPTE
jgi:Ca-activated chloride channel family protein